MPKQQLPHITCEHLLDLHGKDKREHVVVDVRERADFEAGHIKDSLNVPRKELESNIENLMPDKGKRIVVIVGPTQEEDMHEVHDTLKDLGYGSVEFLAGGIDRFCEIAPIEIEEGLLETTPEERGFTGDEATEIDPESHDNEPLF